MINVVKEKIIVLRDFINLVEDIRGHYLFCKDFILKYYYRNVNKKADVIVQKSISNRLSLLITNEFFHLSKKKKKLGKSI